MVKSLKMAFKMENLLRAWQWMRTNSDALFKNYFRYIYRAYSLSAEANLENLRRRLVKETFLPTHAVKLYFPKQSGILRPYTLLSIEDQIVYQALVNVIAENLFPKMRKNYYRSVFGHIYAGKNSLFFYEKWQKGYHRFSDAIRESYKKGYRFTASFDLTACYDSIDHGVLKHFLRDIKLEPEFIDYLCRLLRHWTATSDAPPIYQEHGIPQGPLPSGLLSECVLRYFDVSSKKSSQFHYYRYVDDIRLFAVSEKELRRQLIQLDLHSKAIGLFPQSGKVNIHKVVGIEDEIKSISNPPEIISSIPHPDQDAVRRRLRELSPRLEVNNETRFKFVLAGALPNATLAKRLLKILRNKPHLYRSIFKHISKTQRLSKGVSSDCINLLNQQDLYQAYTSALLRALHSRIHCDFQQSLIDFCRNKYKENYPELVAGAGAILLAQGALNWKQTKILLASDQWWIRSALIGYVREDLIGEPSYESIINDLIRDNVADVALVAVDILISQGLTIHRPYDDVHGLAQESLKKTGLIGRRSSRSCFISEAMIEVLGNSLSPILWRIVLCGRYDYVLPKIVRWRGYVQTDPTAWVNITDTINDEILFCLFKHLQGKIGTYNLGSIGSILDGRNRFARNYPKLFDATKRIHNKRLESDLSHPITRSTGKSTRYILHKELEPLMKAIKKGYLEMWRHW